MTLTCDDERPRPEADLEWWFVHGAYRCAQGPERHFMWSLFRQALGRTATDHHGTFWLGAGLETSTGRQVVTATVERRIVDLIAGSGDRMRASGVDPDLVDELVTSIGLGGVPLPIRVTDDSVTFASGPLDVRWGSQRFVQSASHLDIEFRDLVSDTPCRFKLSPSARRLPVTYPESVTSRLGAMAYQCYPRMTIEGMAGSDPVTGWAWFDHQWGSLDWLVSPGDGGSWLGWDWFGIVLDDGTDVMAMQHRDLRTDQTLAVHATVREPDGRVITTDRFRTEVLESWTSPRTHAPYPVSWRLTFDDVDLQITLRPLCPDQEIPVPGPARAIWEGAASVSAVRGSRQVSGRGRVELYGRARVGDPHRALGDLRNRIDQHIESFLPRHVAPVAGSRSVVVSDLPWHQQSGDYEETIARPAWDMLEGGGKRWRPLFGLLLMEALQVPSAPYEQLLAVAAELPHTGALIIDDIQDRSASRRGKPTTHVRHGVDTAINVGNALYFAPFDLLARTPLLSDAQRLDAFQAMTAELLRAHLGQGTDIRLGRLAAGTTLPVALGNGLERDVLCSYRQKTGAVMASVAELVAIVAGVSPEMRRQTVDFAESLGVAFQIVDDVLNLSEDARLGKTDGEDLVDGKLTYVVLRALKALSAADAAMLWDTIARAAAGQKDVDIVPGLAAIRASGVLAECQREAMTIFEESWSAWRSHVEPSDARLLLGVLCRKMLRRGRPPVAPA